ncbi:MAG: hypothetical protein ACRD96_26160, partial [Bryobacteraceae bacterium]
LVPWSNRNRALAAGLAGGLAVLLDYSGLIPLVALFAWLLLRQRRDTAWYALGAAGPIFLLWFYQWRSFGHPFFPGQHWMPPVEWIERGYQGVSGPQLELAIALLADYRFGLFVSCPLLLLALAAPWKGRLARPHLLFPFAVFVLFWVFFSSVNYTRLQYNTGVRYMVPAIPFLFLPVASVLAELPRGVAYLASAAALAQAWAMAMYRDVERGLGIVEPLLNVLLGGFQLPALTVLSRIGGGTEYFERGVSPLALFALAAAVIYGIWTWKSADSTH